MASIGAVFIQEGPMSMIVATNKQALTLKAKLYRGLADASRLSIIEALRDGPLSVSEIVAATDLSQSNVSNHLACLRDCGLVTREQDGRFAIYQLIDPQVATLLGLTDDILADVAERIYACTRYEPGRDS
jgi:DNA-binding transcriptional ArsR family regulator